MKVVLLRHHPTHIYTQILRILVENHFFFELEAKYFTIDSTQLSGRPITNLESSLGACNEKMKRS